MKTTFSRAFFTAAIILLAALVLVGASFQMLVRNLMIRQVQNGLKEDCSAISKLATAYYADGSVSRQDFFATLSVATRVSGADAVICDSQGRLVLCSDSPMGCPHQGMVIHQDYLREVFDTGMVSDMGMVKGL